MSAQRLAGGLDAGGAMDAPLLGTAFLADPYPAYAALREAGPVHWSEEFFGGAWLVTRHADVDAVLRDTEHFSVRRTGGWVMQSPEVRGELRDFQQLFARAMLFVDASDHTRIRRVVQAGFRQDLLRQFAPEITRRVDALLDAADSGDGFDFMRAVAQPLPADVIAMLMGIPADGRDAFPAWCDDLAAFIGAAMPTVEQVRRARTSLLAMCDGFERMVAQRCGAGGPVGDSLVDRLLRAESAGDIRSGAELLAQCAMLLFAGYETTRNLLGNGLHALLAHPDAWQRLQSAPELWPGAVRELLRFDSPVQYTGRRVAQDLVLHGRRLRRGDLVIALIGCANRDPARFEQADRLDVARRGGSLLSFGAGPHVCIGAGLSLMEAEIVFRRLALRFPGLRLADGAPRWNGNTAYRGLRTLTVRREAP